MRLSLLLFALVLTSIPVRGAPAGGADFNGHLVFDGVDDYVWMLPNASGHSEGTVEVWINASTSTLVQVWGGGNGLPGVTGDWVRLGTHSSTPGFSWGVYATIWRWAIGPQFPVGSWVHVAATWSASGCKLFFNGQEVGTSTYTGGVPTYTTELVGASAYGVSAAMEVDDLRIWDHARSSAEILAGMYAPLPPSVYQDPASGLLAYYPFDTLEDLGVGGDGADDFRDLSLNANHADSDGGLSLSSGIVATESATWSRLKGRFRK
jgi:hypothetical protein